MGKPTWERLGRISGCAKSNTRVRFVEACRCWKAAATLLIVLTMVGPTLIIHAPCTLGRQSAIFAAGMLGDIVARNRCSLR
jgi:hypothetical protein